VHGRAATEKMRETSRRNMKALWANGLAGHKPGVFKHSEETKEKMSALRMGTKATAETKKMLSEMRKGRRMPFSAVLSAAATRRGTKRTAEQRARIKAAMGMRRRAGIPCPHLTLDQVAGIKALAAINRPTPAIAAMYRCHTSTVTNIKYGRTWTAVAPLTLHMGG